MSNSIRLGQFGTCALAAGLLAAGGCELDVENPNSPETERVLATPPDFESFLGGYYKRWHLGMYGSTANQWGMMLVQSFENYSSLSNNCLGQRVGIPRASNDNGIGNPCGGEQQRVYFYMNEVTRVASNAIATLELDNYTLGSTAQDNRALAFAEFLRGISLGYTALVYDSSAIITAATPAADPGELKGYREVMDSALVALERAIGYATAPAAGANGFPLPATWIPSSTTFTAPEFVRLVRSYRARLRANVARTPAERAAVDWAAVVADAQGGITVTHDNITSTTQNPVNSWVATIYGFGTWHQMTPFIVGMGDVSGAYASWIAQPLNDRGATGSFTMVTPDLRFPQGTTRAAQQADFAITSCNTSGTTCKRYFVNRPSGNDPAGGNAWGFSNYDHVRFHPWRIAGDAGTAQNGKFPFFTKAELDLLEAEGQFRRGNFAAAAALINRTRVPNGLAAIAAADATTPVPGGENCVPKVPAPPNYTTIACGTMFEALKWEKRIETAYTHFGAWFLDSRGWGDLPAGTGLHWATPYQDLQARNKAIYSTGGSTGLATAPRGTYGF